MERDGGSSATGVPAAGLGCEEPPRKRGGFFMQCVKPIYLYGVGHVPCGKCQACRLQRTREWAVRIVHETDNFEKSAFVTLTYDDEHLPEDKGLHKRDLQLFFKLLRRHREGKIRYYGCGEYGEKFGRPHYHAIILGLASEESEEVSDAWRRGRVHLGSVNFNSAAYVSAYVMKKYSGDLAKEKYGGREPPFQTCSKGFGKSWVKKNEDYLVRNLGLTIQGAHVAMPRYYRKVLGDKVTQEALNAARLERLEEHRQLLVERGIGPLEEWKNARDVRETRAEDLRAKAELKQRKAF